MDPLSDVLDLSRVRGALMVSVRACAPWGLDLPQWPGAAFHAITSGTAWLRVGDGAPLQLMPGDVFLLPAGARHQLWTPVGAGASWSSAASIAAHIAGKSGSVLPVVAMSSTCTPGTARPRIAPAVAIRWSA